LRSKEKQEVACASTCTPSNNAGCNY